MFVTDRGELPDGRGPRAAHQPPRVWGRPRGGATHPQVFGREAARQLAIGVGGCGGQHVALR